MDPEPCHTSARRPAALALPLILTLALALLLAPAAAPRGAPPPSLALVGARVVYAQPEGPAILDGTVVVAGSRIVAVGPRAAVAVPPGAQVLDCKGLVVTAGFQNSHVHFTEPRWAGADRLPAPAVAAQLAAIATRWGFTTVVDAASLLANTTALRRRIEAGEVPGPRILTAGAGLYPPDGVPFYVREEIPPEAVHTLPQPATPREAEEAVERNVRGGSDIAKLFTGSWWRTAGCCRCLPTSR